MRRHYVAAASVLIAIASEPCLADLGDPVLSVPNPTPQRYGQFGDAVALMQGDMLVGARGQKRGSWYEGAAYLVDGQTGAVQTTFRRPVPQDYDMFGLSVAGLGGQVLVGDPRLYVGAEYVGAAYLFDATTGQVVRTFSNPQPQRHDYFGYRVAALGQNVLVSALQEDGRNGTVYLMNATTGGVIRAFQPPDPSKAWQFGESLTAWGNYVLIGCPDYDSQDLTNSGAAFLFDGSTGQLLHTFESPMSVAYGNFGEAIAISGSKVLIGDAAADRAYLYDAESQELELTLIDQWDDRGSFGSQVAFADNMLLVATSYGPVRAFDADSEALLGAIDVPGASSLPSGYYASSISLAADENLIVVGNPGVEPRDSGAVYVFATPEPATLSLLALGLGALFARRGRRRR